MIASPIVGLTLPQFAQRRGISVERARLLVEPFIAAGIVEEQDGVLVVLDAEIRAGFAGSFTP
jgi:hypothetical protein